MATSDAGPIVGGRFTARRAARPVDLVARDAAVPEQLDLAGLHRDQWRPLLRLAVLLVDDVGTAEDVVQDAFLALQRNTRAPAERRAAEAYLRATVVNRSRSVLRHRYVVARFRRHAPPVDEAVDVLAGVDADSATLQALAALPRRQREVLVLRYWADLPHAEIAEILGVAVGSVKAAASRGLAALRAELEST